MKDQLAVAATAAVVGKVMWKGTWHSVVQDGVNLFICSYVSDNVLNLASFIPLPSEIKEFVPDVGAGITYALSNKFVMETSPMGTRPIPNFFYAVGMSIVGKKFISPAIDRFSVRSTSMTGHDITSVW